MTGTVSHHCLQLLQLLPVKFVTPGSPAQAPPGSVLLNGVRQIHGREEDHVVKSSSQSSESDDAKSISTEHEVVILNSVIFTQAAVAHIHQTTLFTELTSAHFIPSPVSSFLLADLLNLLEKKEISSTAAKRVSTFLTSLYSAYVASFLSCVAIL